MKKLSVAAAFFALVVAGSGFALYEAAGQHRSGAPSHPAPPAPPAAPATPPSTGGGPPPASPQAGRGGGSRGGSPGRGGQGQGTPRSHSPQARRGEGGGDRHRPPQHGGHDGHGPVVGIYPAWPWWGGYPSYPYWYPPDDFGVYSDWDRSYVRIDVKPSDAVVYADGIDVGTVSKYNGIFQSLALVPGPHLLEIRKTGFVPLAVEFNLYPGQTVTYRRTMEPARADSPVPPSAAPPLAPGFEEGAALPAPPDLDAPPGQVKLAVTPNSGEVYVDGFYAGVVDDFDGSQHLQLPPGRHHLSIKLAGYEAIEVDVLIESGRSITYRAEMKKQPF